MTPQEIIDGCVEQIDQSVEEVRRPDPDPPDGLGFGLASATPATSAIPVTPRYEHYAIKTREYRDEGCAAFKMIRAMDSIPGAKSLYWRYPPEVLQHIDFGMKYPVWVGRTRFSIEP